MRKLFLFLALLLGSVGLAHADGCVAVGGINSVPVTGVNCPSESNANTYAATAVALVPAASATDIACITGSATQVIRVGQIRVGGSAGTLISTPVVITKHAVANSGGTAATGTALPVPYKVDTADVAPTATTTSWTANPTINDSTPGIVDIAQGTFQPTSAAGGTPTLFNWTTRAYNEPPTLRGAAQQLCVNLNGATLTTGSISVSFYWTENNS